MFHVPCAHHRLLGLSLCVALGLAVTARALPAEVAAQPGAEVISAPIGGAAEAAAAPEPTAEQLHDELRALRTAMETALNEKDLDALTEHVTPDVVFTTMNGDVVHGPDGIRDYYRKMMEGDDRVVDSITSHFVPDDLSILHGRDVAIAFGSSDDRYVLADGRTFEVAARWTATLFRQDGGWKIAAFHYSTNMFDNPVLDAQRDALIKVGIGALLLVLVVAFLAGRALGRRSSAG